MIPLARGNRGDRRAAEAMRPSGSICEKAAVELVESLAAKSLALVHGLEQAQEVLPNIRRFGVVIGIVAAVGEEIAEKLRREGERLSHVFTEKDEDAAVENYLSEANEPAPGARKARCSLWILFKKGQIEPFAKLPVFVIELIFEFTVPESLLLNKTEQKAFAAAREQGVPMKH